MACAAIERQRPRPEFFRSGWERSAGPVRLRGALATPATLRSIDDRTLAAQVGAGSRMAFEALVQRHGGRVLGVLERRLGDPERALDLCQEVWIRVHRALERDPQAGSRGEFRSWLFAIALNLARDEGRARRRSSRLLADHPVDEMAATIDGDHAAVERREAVDVALARVDEPFRTALVLVDIEGLDYAAAARSAGCAEGTMKSRVARGRARFRSAWERVTDGRRETGT